MESLGVTTQQLLRYDLCQCVRIVVMLGYYIKPQSDDVVAGMGEEMGKQLTKVRTEQHSQQKCP